MMCCDCVLLLCVSVSDSCSGARRDVIDCWSSPLPLLLLLPPPPPLLLLLLPPPAGNSGLRRCSARLLRFLARARVSLAVLVRLSGLT